jgi:hypothetical protein
MRAELGADVGAVAVGPRGLDQEYGCLPLAIPPPTPAPHQGWRPVRMGRLRGIRNRPPRRAAPSPRIGSRRIRRCRPPRVPGSAENRRRRPLLSLAYLVIRWIFGTFAWIARSSRGQALEIVVLRHQLEVLKRQVSRPEFQPRDRVLLAAASRSLPKSALIVVHRPSRDTAQVAWSPGHAPSGEMGESAPRTPSHSTSTKTPWGSDLFTTESEFHFAFVVSAVRVKLQRRGIRNISLNR